MRGKKFRKRERNIGRDKTKTRKDVQYREASVKLRRHGSEHQSGTSVEESGTNNLDGNVPSHRRLKKEEINTF